MKYHRAEEIVNSDATIEVFFHQQPVWINNLDPVNKTAQVTDPEQKSLTVNVDELDEGNQIE